MDSIGGGNSEGGERDKSRGDSVEDSSAPMFFSQGDSGGKERGEMRGRGGEMDGGGWWRLVGADVSPRCYRYQRSRRGRQVFENGFPV